MRESILVAPRIPNCSRHLRLALLSQKTRRAYCEQRVSQKTRAYFEQRVSQQLKKYTHVTKKKTTRGRGVASAARRAVPPAVRRGRPRLCAAAAALLLAHPRPAHPSTRGWAPYSLSAQRAGARTAALTSGSGSRPTAAPTHTEQHAQDSHRTLPLTPLTATGYSDLITGTSLSTPCTRLPVAVASAASCPDQTPATRRRR